jgi:hypothetical protein
MGVKLDEFKEFLINKIIPYVTIVFLLIIISSQYLHISSLKDEVEILSKRKIKVVVVDVVKAKNNVFRVDTIKDTIKEIPFKK